MQGVNILNSVPETRMVSWWWIGVLIIALFAIVVGIIWTFIKNDAIFLIITLVIGFVILLIYSSILSDEKFCEPTGKYKHQVTIDDTVNFKEFSEKYELVKQEGKIYYIKEK